MRPLMIVDKCHMKQAVWSKVYSRLWIQIMRWSCTDTHIYCTALCRVCSSTSPSGWYLMFALEVICYQWPGGLWLGLWQANKSSSNNSFLHFLFLSLSLYSQRKSYSPAELILSNKSGWHFIKLSVQFPSAGVREDLGGLGVSEITGDL